MDLAASLGYRMQGGQRDEALSAEGLVQREWHEIFESINRRGLGTIAEWRRVAARVSRERGLAYRPASLNEQPERGWTLDPIPWVLAADQWTVLENGVSQRTRLFEALLKDIYGPQKAVRERLFPTEILLRHRGYLRSLHNLPPGNGVFGLGISAFDVARDSAGQPFVVNDRFDAPFGLGLALENRSVVNQVLPRLFGRCGVRRIGQFITDWFDHLGKCSPSASGAPQVVILDPSEPGEDSEVGFLANYCGISRVHPSDLTVRDGRVWIRALNGLVPVDVIWKMVPGRNMDSLESESSFARGTAGLFEAMRSGGVAVASHPGVEVVQSPALYPYLPELCRSLLGEELLLPPVATWWCGQAKALAHVTANLKSMVVKELAQPAERRTRYGSRMSTAELAGLKAEILDSPEMFVGQEELVISTIPTSRAGQLTPSGAVLRMFAFCDSEQQVQVMPGGLARSSTSDGAVISTRDYGESKDVWVRSPEKEGPFSIASALSRTRLITPDIVPSRTGENLFWTGRYAERMDTISRFAGRMVDGRVRGFTGESDFGQHHEKLLVKTLFKIFGFKLPAKKDKSGEVVDHLSQILEDRECPVSIPFNLDRFFNASQTAREEWSSASTLAISSCYESWHSKTDTKDLVSDYGSKLNLLQLNLAAFLGLNLDTMTRDEGWALLDAGRRVERAAVVCALLRFLLKAKIDDNLSTLFNESILYTVDSVRTFQSRFRDVPSTELTVRLLVDEKDYPRSVWHLIERIDMLLCKLPVPGDHKHPRDLIAPWLREMEQFHRRVSCGEFDREQTIAFLARMRSFLKKLSDTITVAYFSHAKENV